MQERRNGIWFVAPALGLLGVVYGYPIGRAVVLSLFRQDLGSGLRLEFIGLGNYDRLLGDGRFWQSLANTLLFTICSVGLELGLGLAIALVLNRSFRGRGLVRTIALLPWVLPTAVIALGWAWIFNDQFGLLNDLLLRLGLIRSGVNWLGDPGLAMAATIGADVWKTTPFMAILLLTGLQSIPVELYDAYALDGAGPWRRFWGITLPLLRPQLAVALLFRSAEAFGVFDLIQVMTGGGPAGATETIALYIYATVMRYLDFGYGSALVVVVFGLLLAGVGVVSWRLARAPKDPPAQFR
jgi:multiple sugar transport system permease protein